MRPHLSRRVAALVAATFGATALGLAPSPVQAAGCADRTTASICIIVVSSVDGQTRTVATYGVTADQLKTLSAKDSGLNQRKYVLRKNAASKGGKVQSRPIAQGTRVTLNSLLSDVDPDLYGSDPKKSAKYLETPNAAAVPAVLSADDLADPDAPTPSPSPSPADGDSSSGEYPFFNKLEPIVFLTDSGRLGYLRPLRDMTEDTNASDYFQVTGRLDLTVHTTGSLLAPTVTSSAGTDLDTKASTTFSTTYSGQDKLGLKSILWDFGDGSVKGTKREKPAKSYAKRGTYPVAVTVRLDDGSYGRSSALEVKVDKPPKAPTSGTGGGNGSGGLGGSSGGFVPPSDPFGDSLTPPTETDDPPVEEEPSAPVDDGLVPVEGYVLAGAEIVPGGTPETIPGTDDSNTPAPATQASLGQRVATWVVAALAIVLLVGLGAAGETRWFRHRMHHLRRAA